MLYLFVAVVATQSRHNEELVPFFNWSLFSAARNPKMDTVLIMRSVDGVPLRRPALFYDMPQRFAAARNGDSRLAKALDRLRYAVRTGNSDKERQILATIEGTYMSEADRAEYDLGILVYDPIERLNSGAIQRQYVIRSYRKGRP